MERERSIISSFYDLRENFYLQVEGDVEEGEEGVDELEEDEFGHGVRLELLLRAVVLPLGELGCNSIDIWNLRLQLGRKLGQGLRTCLETHFLAVGLGKV